MLEQELFAFLERTSDAAFGKLIGYCLIALHTSGQTWMALIATSPSFENMRASPSVGLRGLYRKPICG
jgi:hypothetical protein